MLWLEKTCNIFDTTIVNIDGADTKSYTPVYNGIACDFYWKKASSEVMQKDDYSRETELIELEVVLEPDKSLVQKWMMIELFDPIMWSYWEFLIQQAFVNRIWSRIDTISLRVIQRDV